MTNLSSYYICKHRSSNKENQPYLYQLLCLSLLCPALPSAEPTLENTLAGPRIWSQDAPGYKAYVGIYVDAPGLCQPLPSRP